MNRSIEAIPTWSLCYIINGDASGLTDEEIRMVDDAMRKNNIEIGAHFKKGHILNSV